MFRNVEAATVHVVYSPLDRLSSVIVSLSATQLVATRPTDSESPKTCKTEYVDYVRTLGRELPFLFSVASHWVYIQ
jgi:hypothetical protein